MSSEAPLFHIDSFFNCVNIIFPQLQIIINKSHSEIWALKATYIIQIYNQMLSTLGFFQPQI